MDADYLPCETRLLVHEGGYTNDKRDPGGPTNWGITIYDARMYWKPNATAEDVKAMPKSVAIAIYRQKYWLRMACDKLPAGVDDSIFDYGVNSGIGRAGKVLRRCLRMPDNTSAIDAGVVSNAALKDPDSLTDAICDERMHFLRGLSTFDHFGPGWTTRVREVRAYSHILARNASAAARAEAPAAIPAPQAIVGNQGKGAVPAPLGIKRTIQTAPPAGGGGLAVACRDWVAAHPWEAGAIAAGGLVGIGLGLYALDRWHRHHQEKAPAGWEAPPIAALAPA